MNCEQMTDDSLQEDGGAWGVENGGEGEGGGETDQ